jgi:hypothetical protein
LYFTQSACFLFVLFPILVYLAGERTGRCFTSLIPRGVSHTFTLLPKPERHIFTPGKVTQGSLGGDQAPLLLPKGRPIIRTRIYQSDGQGSQLVPEPSLGSFV